MAIFVSTLLARLYYGSSTSCKLDRLKLILVDLHVSYTAVVDLNLVVRPYSMGTHTKLVGCVARASIIINTRELN
jgi:hypothetical protein